MNLKLLGFLVIVTVIKSEKDEKLVDYFTPAKYTYSYGVEDFKTGDYKMHKEERNGDVVKGEYRIADPNGSIRTVTYTADKEHGFQAVVKQSEPLKVSTEFKINHEISTQNMQSTKSSEYQHESSGSSVQDFNEEGFLKQIPISFHKTTENGKSNDNINKEEINQYLQQYQSYISKLQNNHQGNIKLDIKPKFEQQTRHLDLLMSNNLKTKEVEIIKDSSKKQNSNFKLNHKESTTVNQENTKDITKVNQVGKENNSDYYEPNVIEQLHYIPEISEQEIGSGLYKNDVNVLKNYQTISDDIPADLHGNYGQKLNVDQQFVIPKQKVESKQTTQELIYRNRDYVVNGNKHYQELFYQPHDDNFENQYILKAVEIQNPEFSENGKSQENFVVTQNVKQNYYNQGEEIPSVHYKNNQDEVSENLKKVQQFYVHPNIVEENIKTDKQELTKFEGQLHEKTLAEYYGNLQKLGEIEIMKIQKTQPNQNNGEYLNGNHQMETGNKIIEHQSSQPMEQYQLSSTKFAENDYKPEYIYQILGKPKLQFEKNVKV